MFQHSQQWDPTGKTYGRFWIDVAWEQTPAKETITLGVCRTPSIARQKLREYIDTNGINSQRAFTANTAPATTFREQAEQWIRAVSSRRR